MTLEEFASRGQSAQREVDAILEKFAPPAEFHGSGLRETASGAGMAGGVASTASPAQSRPRSLNPTPFLNREACRDFLLEHAISTRAHPFDRVSADTLVMLNEVLRNAMVRVVRQLPSKGRTI